MQTSIMFGMGDLGCIVINILHQHAQTCEQGLKLHVGVKSPKSKSLGPSYVHSAPFGIQTV